ncbi:MULTISPECIES: serine/threonine-protein kinase [unclassified Streptomyces]|uniref:serine/threonine-protein kinase n=1 Tax=unclassified Streptomyces TaxID=2593676 RepID=UPI00332E6E4E
MNAEGEDQVFQPLRAGDPAAIAGYRITARLGEGGMGTVYLSYTPGGRPVAIKVIRPDLAGDPEFRRRFGQEVQAAQLVQGLYTAPVIDSDTEGERPWLATAYVAGPSLQAAVTRHGPLPVPAVVLAVAGIAEALQAIHGAGIVHRDLKPSNVLLAADGPRVIDFGIARAADATSLTRSGVIVGTPAFMTPEQASGAACTPATDVFALGQIAVYAATGAPAFGEGTSHTVLYRIVHEEPSLSDLPEELNELVTRCLDKDAGLRPSPAEIIDICRRASPQTELRRPDGWLPPAVAADIDRHTAALPPPQPARRKRIALAVAAVLVAALAGAGVTALLGNDDGGSKDLGQDTTKQPTRTSSPNSPSPTSSPSEANTGGGPETTAPPADPKPATYKLNIPVDYSISLADEPPRPYSGNGALYDGDFGYGEGYFATDTGASSENTLVLLRSGQTGSLDTCRTDTRYTTQISRENVGKGSQICITTGAGHIGLVTVRSYSPDDEPAIYVTVDLTVWRNAVEPEDDS